MQMRILQVGQKRITKVTLLRISNYAWQWAKLSLVEARRKEQMLTEKMVAEDIKELWKRTEQMIQVTCSMDGSKWIHASE